MNTAKLPTVPLTYHGSKYKVHNSITDIPYNDRCIGSSMTGHKAVILPTQLSVLCQARLYSKSAGADIACMCANCSNLFTVYHEGLPV